MDGLQSRAGAQERGSALCSQPQYVHKPWVPASSHSSTAEGCSMSLLGFLMGKNRCTAQVNSKNPKGRQRAA